MQHHDVLFWLPCVGSGFPRFPGPPGSGYAPCWMRTSENALPRTRLNRKGASGIDPRRCAIRQWCRPTRKNIVPTGTLDTSWEEISARGLGGCTG
jgi:hypothetical protein